MNNYNWIDTSEYPFKSNFFDVNGYKLHYIDEGKGEVILFVHGTPSWSFEFRHIIKRLRDNYRCIAIDHIGFGLSDKPKHYDYSLQNHSHTLEKFINEKKLENFNLIVHDFGGPIAFHFAIQHPEKIKNLVILNTWMWSFEDNPGFIKMKKMLASSLLPFLYKFLNFSPKVLLPQSFGKKKISKNILNHYIKPFATPGERNGALAFAKSLLNDQQWFENLWIKKQAISDKPALLVWGMKDPFVKPDFLHKFQEAFLNAQTVMLPECGHFPQEEEPDITAASVESFLSDNILYKQNKIKIS